VSLTRDEAMILNIPQDTQVYEGRGCGRCATTGIKGRAAVYEYFLMNEPLRRQLINDPIAFAGEIRAKQLFRANALKHLLAGTTTAAEVIRVLNRS